MIFRIATYNIHKGLSAVRSLPIVHALKQAINQMEATLVFLQEVQGRHDRHAVRHKLHWPEEAQHSFLAGDSHHAAYGLNAEYGHGHHGNALLSRFPIGFSRNQDVSDHAFESRGILHCVVQLPTVEVHCYVVHLGLFSRGRVRQTEALIAAVKSSAPDDAPIIVAGDFNDWGNELGESLRNRLGVTEVFDECRYAVPIDALLEKIGVGAQKMRPARTFPAAMPFLQLDRIYVRGFVVESAEVLHGATWAKLSDHAPVIATVRLK